MNARLSSALSYQKVMFTITTNKNKTATIKPKEELPAWLTPGVGCYMLRHLWPIEHPCCHHRAPDAVAASNKITKYSHIYTQVYICGD